MTLMTIKQHDTAPPLQVECTDAGTPVDLTGASSVKVVGSRDGQAVFSEVTTGDAQGVVTRPWADGDTDTTGILLVEVEVTWPGGGVETFPPNGYLTVLITPDLG